MLSYRKVSENSSELINLLIAQETAEREVYKRECAGAQFLSCKHDPCKFVNGGLWQLKLRMHSGKTAEIMFLAPSLPTGIYCGRKI